MPAWYITRDLLARADPLCSAPCSICETRGAPSATESPLGADRDGRRPVSPRQRCMASLKSCRSLVRSKVANSEDCFAQRNAGAVVVKTKEMEKECSLAALPTLRS